MKKNAAGKAKNIKLIILDVDGVMTDGGIIIGSGKEEYKRFEVKDGTGVAIARNVGLEFAIISGRFSGAITNRAREMKIRAVFQDVKIKMRAYEKLKSRFKLKDSEICFIGDEIIDLPVIKKCGFSAAPFDAVAEVKRAADFVTKKGGGKGCVRETIGFILKKKGLWKEAVYRYLKNEK